MFVEEALWIRAVLGKLDLRPGAVVLDLGSSTSFFRGWVQPFIEKQVFAPLRERSVRVLHVDRRKARGVDVVWDLCSAQSLPPLAPADVVLCTSLLEHVDDRGRVLSLCLGLVKPGGSMILTVPHSFRRHPDPIDTMYRPGVVDLERLFQPSEYEPLASSLIPVSAESVPWSQAPAYWVSLLCKTLGVSSPVTPRLRSNSVAAVAFRKIPRSGDSTT